MNQDLVINARYKIPSASLSWTIARASGPGGQNVNKVSSKAILTWDPQATPWPEEVIQRVLSKLPQSKVTSENLVKVTASETRDQHKNRLNCQTKLIQLVKNALRRPIPRKATRPTRASKERRLESKKRRSSIKAGRRWKPSD